MRHFTLVTMIAVTGTLLQGTPARAEQGTLTEVGIARVFIPPHGYDDNDNVLATLEVTLPDPCYLLRDARITRKGGSKFEVRAYANRRTDGACGTGDLIGASNEPQDIQLGVLEEGDYEINYKTEAGHSNQTLFHVDKARVATLDNFNYASVTDVVVEDLQWDTQDVTVTLSGFTSSRCFEVSSEKLQVIRDGDTVVLLPILSNRSESIGCIESGPKVPFTKKVVLGQFSAGEYLIHVRSRNGKAVNRILDVYRWPPNPK